MRQDLKIKSVAPKIFIALTLVLLNHSLCQAGSTLPPDPVQVLEDSKDSTRQNFAYDNKDQRWFQEEALKVVNSKILSSAQILEPPFKMMNVQDIYALSMSDSFYARYNALQLFTRFYRISDASDRDPLVSLHKKLSAYVNPDSMVLTKNQVLGEFLDSAPLSRS